MPTFDKPIRVLFLQGPPSPFAKHLGAELSALGAQVLRVNLCIGDWIYWRGPGTLAYRGSLAGWDGYLARLVADRGITDIVYFGDRLPYHRVARQVAGRMGIRAVSYEYGYLRPDWIVAEPGGQSAYSHLTQDPTRLRQLATDLPAPDLNQRYHHDFKLESSGDYTYHMANYLLWFLYPRFVRDRMFNPLIEYLSYPLRFHRARRARPAAHALVARLADTGATYYVALLQMQNDYQVRANSPFADQRDCLSRILASFAADAPDGTTLVVKVHPLDNGMIGWHRFLKREARRLGVEERVVYLDGGDLDLLLSAARGAITINSTAGLSALAAHCPLMAMGIAVYDMPDLTHQGPLSQFWTDPDWPDPGTVDALQRVLAAHLHVRGDFYGPEGRRAAARALAARLVACHIGGPACEPAPPRLDRARAMGIPVDGFT